MINSILGVMIATGSIFNTYETNQQLVDNNTGVAFTDLWSGCFGWMLVAGHNYKALGAKIRLLSIGDKVEVGECVYTVTNRQVVKRTETKLSQLIKDGTITLQTCRGNGSDYILLITLGKQQ